MPINQLLKRMKQYPYLNFHTHHLTNMENTIEILNTNDTISDNSLQAMGLHPWCLADEMTANAQFAQLKAKVMTYPILLFAIGETGLDKLCSTNWGLQNRVFRQHITLSEQVKKPLIIHCVRAHQEILAIHKVAKPKMPWILHGFDKNVELAFQMYQHGFRFSLGATLLHPTKNWSAFFEKIPLTHIFLETDDRQDITIQTIYAAAATWANVDIETLRKQIFQNFELVSQA
jgi:TatD DNase family protein